MAFRDALISKVGERYNAAMTLMLSPGTSEFGMMVLPILCYWAVSIFYDCLDQLPMGQGLIGRCRITRKQRGKENFVTRTHVITRVLFQHAIQLAVAFVVMMVDPDQCSTKPARGWLHSSVEFFLGMFIMDTYQFWIHRAMHVYPYLYKNFHSHHHRLLIPYAHGALYNHPVEALLLDTVGGVITLYASGMSCEVGAWFMSFATIKTVLDHCGYSFPLNPLHDLFPNSAAYHDVHHDIKNIKKNYSQPFFVHWDILMGSYKSPKGFHLTGAENVAEVAAADKKVDSKMQGAVAVSDAAVTAATSDAAAAHDDKAKDETRKDK